MGYRFLNLFDFLAYNACKHLIKKINLEWCANWGLIKKKVCPFNISEICPRFYFQLFSSHAFTRIINQVHCILFSQTYSLNLQYRSEFRLPACPVMLWLWNASQQVHVLEQSWTGGAVLGDCLNFSTVVQLVKVGGWRQAMGVIPTSGSIQTSLSWSTKVKEAVAASSSCHTRITPCWNAFPTSEIMN